MTQKTTIVDKQRPTNNTSAQIDGQAGTAAVLVGLNGLYMLLVAFGNITDYDSNHAFVQHVLAMDTTNFGSPTGGGLDPDVMWRSITTPWIQTVAYISIITWEVVAAAVLLVATVTWARVWTRGRTDRRAGDSRRAQRYSTVGLLMIVTLFFGGFICIGGEWFAMYRSTAWNGLDPAFRNSVLALLTLIVVLRPHKRPELVRPTSQVEQ